MSSFVRIVFNSYEVILYVIFIEEIIQPKVGQASECAPCLGSFLCRTVKSAGSTDADDFCFHSPIDDPVCYKSHLLERGSHTMRFIVRLFNDVLQLQRFFFV
jgi:hypothetical protein